VTSQTLLALTLASQPWARTSTVVSRGACPACGTADAVTVAATVNGVRVICSRGCARQSILDAYEAKA
jgi:hypothetical protein